MSCKIVLFWAFAAVFWPCYGGGQDEEKDKPIEIQLAKDNKTQPDIKEAASLGRAFVVGMLYDARTDRLLPSLSLWNKTYLEQMVRTVTAPSTSFDLDVSNSFDAKAYILDVSASLKMSVASGMVEISGSGAYLNNDVRRDDIARITLFHKRTSHFKYLDIGDALNAVPPYLFYFSQGQPGYGIATHVVTEVLYGATAFFTFDLQVNNVTDILKAKGDLRIIINIAGTFTLNGSASVVFNNTDINIAENITCGFIGDYVLPANPTTLNQSMNTFRNLSELYDKYAKGGVPISVKLTPLRRFRHPVDELLFEIDTSIVQQTTALLEGIGMLQKKIESLIDNTTTAHFPRILQSAREFKDILLSLRNQFQLEIAPILPRVRSGQAESKEILKILESIEASPFKITEMDRWVEIKKKQIGLLSMQQKYFQNIKDEKENIPFHTTYADMAAEIIDYNYDYVIALFYRVEEQHDEFINDLRCRLDNMQSLTEIPKLGNKKFSYEVSKFDDWVNNKELIRDLAKKQYRFFQFCKENQPKLRCFLYSDKPEDGQTAPNIIMKLYDRGNNVAFDTPTEPRNVAVKDVNQRFEITWDAPAYGAEHVSEYEVRYRPITTWNRTDEPWIREKVPTSQTQHTIKCLTEDVAHLLTVRALTDAGHTKDRLLACFVRGIAESTLIRGNLSDLVIDDMKTCNIRKRNKILDRMTLPPYVPPATTPIA